MRECIREKDEEWNHIRFLLFLRKTLNGPIDNPIDESKKIVD
jgi:hypothetical protein